MSSSSLRNVPRALARSNARAFSSARTGRTNKTCSLLRTQQQHQRLFQTQWNSAIASRPVPVQSQYRTFVELKPNSGKSEADLVVEELQELCDLHILYEIFLIRLDRYNDAKDEFEIAVDSTNSATIYAAGDRESAREYLDQLLYVYTAYTHPKDGPPPDPESVPVKSPVGEEPTFDPESVMPEIREQVKKRVGQRIRELRAGVQRLDDMAGHEG